MSRRAIMSAPPPLLTLLALLALLAGGCPGDPDDDATDPADDDTDGDDDTSSDDDDSGSDDDSSADDDTTEEPSDCEPVEGEPVFDPYGGDARVALGATGLFRTEKLCDRWWLVTPDGHPFASLGVNNVGPYGDASQESGERRYHDTVTASYDTLDDWADTAEERLTGWGFNTAGCWSDSTLMFPRMPYTYGLSLAGDDWIEGTVSDYFDPAWEAEVVDATAGLGERASDPNLIGYFLDNEIRWGPDWRGLETLLQLYLALPADAPGKAVAVQLLLDELGGLGGVNTFLGTAFATEDELLAATDAWEALGWGSSPTEAELTTRFLERAADRYFDVTTSAIRTVDPGHMILGNREVSIFTRPEVYQAADAYVDLLSINSYVFFDVVTEGALALSGSVDPADGFADLNAAIDRPVLITEFGFRADDSGLPNSWPPQYPTLETQAERADAFEEYAREKQSVPWIVGYHWFEWVDQPQDGRFDGEDNNWGLVDEEDQPYTEVVDRMAAVNPDVWSFLEVPREDR